MYGRIKMKEYSGVIAQEEYKRLGRRRRRQMYVFLFVVASIFVRMSGAGLAVLQGWTAIMAATRQKMILAKDSPFSIFSPYSGAARRCVKTRSSLPEGK